jgi:hypothetical protein
MLCLLDTFATQWRLHKAAAEGNPALALAEFGELDVITKVT